MGSEKTFKQQNQSSSYLNSSFFTKKLLPWTLSLLLPIAFIHFYLYPLPSNSLSSDQLLQAQSFIVSTSTPPPPPSQEIERSNVVETTCDYGNGKWVHDKTGPLYNGTSCKTIKDNQNCMNHGRPDKGYLYWRWKPRGCKLIPRFDPKTFLQLLRNKHLAFVGDSVARNQLESLLCMLATESYPNLVYTSGEEDNKFRKWHFDSHNLTVSIYWSPFLVKGIEKKSAENQNTLHLESVDEIWAGDLGRIDMVILSIGHWFLHPAVFYYGESVLGCHYCSPQNYSEIGFYDVYGKAFKTALNAIIERKGSSNGIGKMDVIVTTFSPAHFEGEWDKFGACSKIKPYKPGEKQLEGMDKEMRKVEMEEIKIAKEKAQEFSNLRLEAIDVTKLSLLRPDGHPGPYLYPFPFANGISDRVQNDCVHWCLPGPIDTWNEILLEIMRKWEAKSQKERIIRGSDSV